MVKICSVSPEHVAGE